MKGLIFLTLVFALAPFAYPGEKPEAAPVKKDCPLCKFPGRAALFAGPAKSCPADCAKLCCTGTEVTYLVEGLVGDRCSANVTTALTSIDGVKVEALSHQDGQAVVKYDPAKVKPAQLVATIVASGYKVTGEQVSFKVTGLTDESSAGVMEKALVATEGVRRIETVCHKSGVAIVVFDPAQTSRDKIAAAINSTKFKVAKDG
jgi:copper chaperone CopZ